MNYYDTISYFEYVQDVMLDKVNEMEKLCWDFEKKTMTNEVKQRLIELNNSLHYELINYFTLEEDLLFPELEHVLPSPTSTSVMKNEHTAILQLDHSISEKLSDTNDLEKNKETLLSTIISFVDIMQRHIHKKNDVLYHEASSFLSEKTLNEIYKKILQKKKITAS